MNKYVYILLLTMGSIGICRASDAVYSEERKNPLILKWRLLMQLGCDIEAVNAEINNSLQVLKDAGKITVRILKDAGKITVRKVKVMDVSFTRTKLFAKEDEAVLTGIKKNLDALQSKMKIYYGCLEQSWNKLNPTTLEKTRIQDFLYVAEDFYSERTVSRSFLKRHKKSGSALVACCVLAISGFFYKKRKKRTTENDDAEVSESQEELLQEEFITT